MDLISCIGSLFVLDVECVSLLHSHLTSFESLLIFMSVQKLKDDIEEVSTPLQELQSFSPSS